ncbi:MAG: hypothetical protein ABJQ29_09590 [Luteolibacter sp.]
MSSPDPTARQRGPNPRPMAWGICLAIASICCGLWSLLPAIEAQPFLRIGLFAAIGFAMLGLVFLFPESTDRSATRLILLSAVFLRILLWPAPISDDVNRYAWEGQLTAAGENPYSAPADDTRWQDRRDTRWEAMNHRDRPTAYPPGIQWINAAAASLSPSLKSFKALALLGDLAALLLLLRLLKENAAPLRWAGFYAFNPIVLISFAAEAHFDSLMVAALLAAILAASREKKSVWLWLGLAIQIKLVCLILIPLFLTRKLLRSSWLILPILILPGLPFLSALPEWFEGVRTFAGSGAFNAPLYTLLASAGITASAVKAICTSAFLIAAAAICIARWRGAPLIDSCLWMLGALLVCSPIVHFWYLAWLLPLAALRPSFGWITLSITMAAYFTAWWTQEMYGWWGFGHGIAAIIWLPWLIATFAQNRFFFSKRNVKWNAMGATRTWRNKSNHHPSSNFSPQSPSIALIIPVLKPDPTLVPLLETLRHGVGPAAEIVVVACEASSSPLPEKILTAPRGRGNQIAAGISATSSEWILIVHSDSIPRPDFAKDLKNATVMHPDASLLIFGQRFDKPSLGTLLVEALNELRVVFGGVAFGDQTMLIRRAALEAAGGFPAQPLMEDVEASMRLATRGEVIYLGREWQISAVKWGDRFTHRFVQVIRLVASYQIARLRSREHAAAVSERMYREYYGEPKA